MTDVTAGNKIETVHWGAFLLQGVHKQLDVPVPDHLVGSGVQVEMRPGRRSLLHSIIVVLVDVLGQRVEHDSQQENSHSKKRQQDVPNKRTYVWPQGGHQCTQGPADVSTPRGTVHYSSNHTQRTELFVTVQQLYNVPIQHEATVTEYVKENRTVLHLVVIKDLQQLQGRAAQLLVAKRL